MLVYGSEDRVILLSTFLSKNGTIEKKKTDTFKMWKNKKEIDRYS